MFKNKRGFSLVEVMVAMAVIALVVAVTMSLFSQSMLGIFTSREKGGKLYEAQGKIEKSILHGELEEGEGEEEKEIKFGGITIYVDGTELNREYTYDFRDQERTFKLVYFRPKDID